jgi:hypothetical protein
VSTITASRFAAYTALIRARKTCRACPGLLNPADCDGGQNRYQPTNSGSVSLQARPAFQNQKYLD